MTKAIYGAKPIDLGLVDISPREMMFWLYLPIKLPNGTKLVVPDNLIQFEPVITKSLKSVEEIDGQSVLDESYVYISAKTMHISPDSPGNRPGWHSDGFLTDDLNFVWSDCSPTYYWEPEELVAFTQDHIKSLEEMQELADEGPIVAYPDKHLVRMDQSVIHRVGDVVTSMIRSFCEISVSKHKYDLVGNSINWNLAPDWKYYERSEIRNSPSKAAHDFMGK